MNKKFLAIAVVFSLVCVSSLVLADTSNITGSFDPQTSMSISLWNTTFSWGSLAYNGNVSQSSQINNTGTVTIDTTIHNQSYSGDLTFVAVAENNALDEFACIFDSADSSWIDMGSIASPATLDSDLGIGSNSDFEVCILGNGVGWSVDHGSQTFNLVVTYTENT